MLLSQIFSGRKSIINTADPFEGKIYPPLSIYLKMMEEVTMLWKMTAPSTLCCFKYIHTSTVALIQLNLCVYFSFWISLILTHSYRDNQCEDLSFILSMFLFAWIEQITYLFFISLYIIYKKVACYRKSFVLFFPT